MAYLSLTAEAQKAIAAAIRPGDLVVDATLGNGHDCCFLAHLVGPSGLVLGFDIQKEAIDASRQRLETAGLMGQVCLIQDSHANLASHLPQGKPLAGAMFNLGYLPGSDKGCITRPESTLAGLGACLAHLKPGGCISLLAYLGHAGGAEEYEALRAFLATLDRAIWRWEETPASSDRAPRLVCCWKTPSQQERG